MFSDEFQKELDEETLRLMYELVWKKIYKFSSKWHLPTIMVAIPGPVRDQLERDFRAAYPNLDFEEEWRKCLEEL